MSHRIIWSPSARRAISSTLPEPVAAAVWEFVTGALAENPHRVGKRLREPLDEAWSARRGQYRVLYEIDDERVAVTILTVDHRRDVYRP